jgi:hypothetical protein
LIDLPTTLAEVQNLVDNQVQESLHLDYKDSRALGRDKASEIAKDVSAFANADGGTIIYGVTEANHVPEKVDEGVDHHKLSHEWLEQIIRSNITPRIDGLRIAPIRLSADKSIYAVHIPKSYRGPHQEMNSKRYFKRYDFSSVPLEDYEINDIRNRRQMVPPLINIDTEIRHKIVIYLKVTNIGTLPAEDVTFEFSDTLIWRSGGEAPRLLTHGAKYFPPGKTFHFWYHSAPEIFAENSKIPSSFDITVHYFHPEIGQRISDVFHLDFRDYFNSSVVESDIYEHGRIIKDVFEKLVSEVKKLNSHMDLISSISGATGLNLSASTLRNLRHLLVNDDQFEKIDPSYFSYRAFKEVLTVDDTMALQLDHFFRHREPGKRLTDVEGMTEELAEKIHRYFLIAPE